MITLKGKQIYLRALEPEDLDFVYAIENDESIWELSHTQTPYSKYLIKQYLEQAHKDIYEAKQLRLVISNFDNEVLGLIDLFELDFKNRRCGVGLLIKEELDRGKGVGTEALQLVIKYVFNQLQLKQLYCNVSEINVVSLKLFQKQGFEIIGLKKDWNNNNGIFENEFLLQLINTENVH